MNRNSSSVQESDSYTTLNHNPSKDITIESDLFHGTIENNHKSMDPHTHESVYEKEMIASKKFNSNVFFSEESIEERLQELEGECRIKKY